MFSSIRRFFKRHQYKILIGSTIAGGVFFLTHYAQYKVREWQKRELKALFEKSRKLQHFEHLEKTCDQITLTLASNVRNTIITELDTKSIIAQLKLGSTDKVTLWHQLKVLSITRSVAMVYAYTMLVTFLRIQIYLLNGHMYLNQMSVDVKEDDIREQYLKLSSYFIQEGVKELCCFIKSKVEQITASISLNNKLNLREVQQMYWSIVTSIFTDNSNDPIKKFASYTISQQDYEGQKTPMFSKIIDQTLDLLESDEVQTLTQSNIRSGLASLIDRMSVYFIDFTKAENGVLQQITSKQDDFISTNLEEMVTMSNGSDSLMNMDATTIPMAKIIPIISKQISDNPEQKDATSDILERLMLSKEIKTFGANIYEAFSCTVLG